MWRFTITGFFYIFIYRFVMSLPDMEQAYVFSGLAIIALAMHLLGLTDDLEL